MFAVFFLLWRHEHAFFSTFCNDKRVFFSVAQSVVGINYEIDLYNFLKKNIVRLLSIEYRPCLCVSIFLYCRIKRISITIDLSRRSWRIIMNVSLIRWLLIFMIQENFSDEITPCACTIQFELTIFTKLNWLYFYVFSFNVISYDKYQFAYIFFSFANISFSVMNLLHVCLRSK